MITEEDLKGFTEEQTKEIRSILLNDDGYLTPFYMDNTFIKLGPLMNRFLFYCRFYGRKIL